MGLSTWAKNWLVGLPHQRWRMSLWSSCQAGWCSKYGSNMWLLSYDKKLVEFGLTGKSRIMVWQFNHQKQGSHYTKKEAKHQQRGFKQQTRRFWSGMEHLQNPCMKCKKCIGRPLSMEVPFICQGPSEVNLNVKPILGIEWTKHLQDIPSGNLIRSELEHHHV